MRLLGLMLCMLFLPCSFALALQPEEVRISFSSSVGELLDLSLPDADNSYDLETDRRHDGQLFAVQLDLDGDTMPEFFVRTLCGNGGCDYPIFDGKTKRYIGSVFGSAIWLLKRASHGMPVIQSFSHVSAERANVTTYEWNGSRYGHTASAEIAGEEPTEALYRSLKNAPQWKPDGMRP